MYRRKSSLAATKGGQLALWLAGAVFLPAMSYAQSGDGEATIDQLNGNDNIAEIVQTNAPLSEATITQDGSLNYGLITQTGPTEFGMRGFIYQEGTANEAVVEQSDLAGGAIAEIDQYGSNNYSYTLQQGFQAGSIGVQQYGDFNEVSIVQSSSRVEVTQTGYSNEAVVEQGSPSGDNSYTSLLQEGENNRIEVYQPADAFDATLRSEQIGSDNHTVVLQTNETPPYASNIMLYTEGIGNFVEINHEDPGSVSFTLTQTGDNNVVDVERQVGDPASTTITSLVSNRNVDVIYQSGVDADITIERSNTHDSTTWTDQSTAYSSIEIEQLDSSSVAAEIYQAGLQNFAHISQINSSGADALIMQTGTLGTAMVLQNGATNSMATIMQGGEGYSATVMQGGADNSAFISQM